MPRPKKLETFVREEIKKSALYATREILAGAILDKLRHQGICTDGFPVDKIVDQMVGDKQGKVSWGNDDEARTNHISFTEEERHYLLSRIKEETDRADSSDFFQECWDSTVELLLQTLVKGWPEQKLHEDSQLNKFRKRIERTWGTPINLFRLMLTSSRELFLDQEKSLQNSKSKRDLHLREALFGIHARALRTSTAVLVLLENGLADDAYARWRTLYELSVVGAFLSVHGEKAAERYLAHEAVVLRKQLNNALSWGGGEMYPKQQKREIERNYQSVISKFGKQFKNNYGWAGCFIGKNNPRFVDLEEAVKGKGIVPPYKESSLQVHGGRAGLFGLSSNDYILAIGHSHFGLEIPLMHTSFCLMQVTIAHLNHSPSRDSVVLSFFEELDKKILKHCKKVAKKLVKAE